MNNICKLLKKTYESIKKLLICIISKVPWLIKIRDNYTPINNEEYLERFGVSKKLGGFIIKDKVVLDNAYNKAWENRNFEIDKFWIRAAYFWGFIVLTFGAYINLLTSEHNQKAMEMHIDLYLLLLGFLFSLSWYLVIRGSKYWQENWEAHIDNLEDLISGPLYKTIHYSKSSCYSVSKLNEIMALVVILVWVSLFINYANSNLIFTMVFFKINWQITLSIFGTVIFASVLGLGYCKGGRKIKVKGFFDRLEK